MFKYAQLDSNNVVKGISLLNGKIAAEDMILINDMDVVLDSIYNPETGEFTAPVILEPTPIEAPPTVEEMQAQTLINTEYLIAMNEMGIEGGKV
ncbi:hypothetical protein Q8G28_15325 [Lysinibacillus capsici]|uniref:hypothetical protein n=1 Tax=Lysinibacillus capsici TaxID=2115968 RepID=UPI0027303B90|nr:hypothetical protein [Lysinibacillus capsici]MDP1394755.1 hypothetical protein [Lysinibacillus capsici]MDP1415184.1 hypothetical protein [Lysinibacillus capsici]MDP1431118.1 hypothetical protein [Lysinibacillus capsici]